MQGRAACGVGPGVEHIPELKEYEYGEEEGELVRRESAVGSECHFAYVGETCDVGMLEIVQKSEEE